ncbi:hypothetical protein IBL26_10065 [Roseomonas aerophila]|uniref:Carbohydrate binding module xylan-binding domain-containing protein n=1 Tax=Teichococcus aerophilus TaxID=1224513 RepID=A0ABR7RKX8_9PROT|nr:carbohydrate-binding domain-containing protein [Pseudoroseomonas aerophila]MBC9207179.1 hypothetical protein [Pseudoroseomonas aerophila]
MQIDLNLENAGADTLAGGITTFGQVFTQGEVSAKAGLVATVNGVDIPVQMDVKTTYADGSVKMAVLSMARPDLPAGAIVDVALSTVASATASTPIDLSSALNSHSFAVDLTSQGQTTHVDVLAALKQALADGTASFWQKGDLATQARVEIPLDGSQRLIFDVTAFKGGGMSVEAQFNNDGVMGTDGGRVNYKVAVSMDGQVVAEEHVNQAQYQNWHQSYSSNGTDGGQGLGDPAEGWLNIRQDIAHLQATGAVAHYDLTVGISDTMLDGFATATQSNGWGDPLATNEVSQFMPGTGARADIGITTESNTAWLMSQDPRAAAYALGQAETASAVTWHLWDTANKGWLSTEDYPSLWTDERGGTGSAGDASSGGLTQQIGNSSGWDLDSAHQPDLSYVPYLMTGQRWMLDNLNAQASWNIVAQWPSDRANANDIVVDGNQVRGAAWALRQIDEAAWAAPDGSAEKAYFTEASEANWSWLVSKIPEWTAEQGEAHGWLPGVYGVDGAMPPWQQDYFASTVIAAASRGNADALTFLEWQTNFLVGRFTHEGQGFDQHDGAAYLIAIADGSGKPYQTWAEIGAQTDAHGWSNNQGWDNSQGDYAQLALATLAGIAHLTGSAEAAAAYEALVADNAPFSTAADFARDPTFALAAPGTINISPTLPVTPPVVIPPITIPPVVIPPVVTTPEITLPGTPSSSTDGSGTPVVTPPTDTTPAKPLDPAGSVSLSIWLGADSWRGDPKAIVTVDGVTAFHGNVSASHESGGMEIHLGDVSARDTHVVEVEYLNDVWGGDHNHDRNLYVEDVRLNGVSTGDSAPMEKSGTVTFDVSYQDDPQHAVAPAMVVTDHIFIS